MSNLPFPLTRCYRCGEVIRCARAVSEGTVAIDPFPERDGTVLVAAYGATVLNADEVRRYWRRKRYRLHSLTCEGKPCR